VAAIGMFYYERNFRTFALFWTRARCKTEVPQGSKSGVSPTRTILYLWIPDGRDESDIEDLSPQDDYLTVNRFICYTVLKDAKIFPAVDGC